MYKNVESSDDSNSDEEMMHVRTAASTQGNSESSDSEVLEVPCQRPRRSRTMPAYFRGDCDLCDEDDGVICAICKSKEPSDVRDEVIFWVDCE